MLTRGPFAELLGVLAGATPVGRAFLGTMTRRALAASGLFDAEWYRRSVPGAPAGGELDHYFRLGAREGHDPHPLFDTSFYLERNPDVARSGHNPLAHYLLAGAREGRDPHPLFDTSFYAEGNRDVQDAGVNPLIHYVGFGAHEGRAPNALFHLGMPGSGFGGVDGHDWGSLVSGAGAAAFDRLRRESSLSPFQGWLAWALGQATAGRGDDDGRPEGWRGGVVFLAGEVSCSGAAHLLLGLLQSFRERTRTPLYALLGEGGSLEPAFARLAPTVNLKSIAPCGSLAEVAEVLRGLGATVAFCAGLPAAPLVGELRRRGIRIVVLARDQTPAALRTLGDDALRSALAAVDHVVLPTPSAEAALAPFVADAGAVTLSVVPPGLARDNPFLDERKFARMQVAKRVPVGAAPFLVLGCGYDCPRKGLDVFAEVARDVLASRRDPEIHFVWIGEHEPPWTEGFRRDLEGLHLQGRVHAPVGVDDPSLYFAAADMFLLTSREDTLPLVALEAMEAGLPVVAFEGSGSAALALEEAGLLVPYPDVAAMARAVVRLHAESELGRRLGAAGRLRVRECHRPDRLIEACAAIARPEAGASLSRRWSSAKVADAGAPPAVPAGRAAPPLVSVVMPACNHASFVEAALRSVAAQDYPRVELIVVDDGSTDDTVAVIDRTLADLRLERCELERQPNLGTATALDRAVCLSRGEYVAVLNSDDCYLPGRLRALVERMTPGGDAFAFTGVTFCDEAGRPFSGEPLPPAAEWYREAFLTARRLPTAGFALLARSLTVTTSNFFFTRGLFEKLNGFAHELRLCHDWDFVLRATHHGEPVFLARPLLLYRHHRTNTVWRSGHLKGSEGRIALANLQGLWEGTSPNPLAPSPTNWPAYFPKFAGKISPWFSTESLATLVDPAKAAGRGDLLPGRPDPLEPATIAALALSLEEGGAPTVDRGLLEALADCERSWLGQIPGASP